MNKPIYNKLSALLKKNGMTVKRLAEECNLPINSVYNILYGRARNYSVVDKIAKNLGVSVDYLLSEKENIEILTNIKKSDIKKFEYNIFNKCISIICKILDSKNAKISIQVFIELSINVYIYYNNQNNFEKCHSYAEGLLEQIINNNNYK